MMNGPMGGRYVHMTELGDLDEWTLLLCVGGSITGSGDVLPDVTVNVVDYGMIKSAWFKDDTHVANAAMLPGWSNAS